MHQRRWGVALAAVLCGFVAPTAFAQGPEVPVECGADVRLTGAALFDPPVPGPVVYEWRDASGEVVGREETLSLGALKLTVGSHPLTLTARGADDRRPTQTMVVVITDNTPPRVKWPFGALELASGSLNAEIPPGLTVTDDCDAAPTVTFSPAGPYEAGDTPVTVTARDQAGNNAAFVVTFRVPPPPAAPPTPPTVTAPPVAPPAAPPAAAPVVQEAPPSPQAPAPVTTAPVVAPAVVVVPPGTPVEDPRRFPWWILAIVVAVLAAGTWALKQKKPPKPAVTVVVARPRLDAGTQRLRASSGSFRVLRRDEAAAPAARSTSPPEART